MIYRCRTTKPSQSDWCEIDEDTPELAANEFHSLYSGLIDEATLRVPSDRSDPTCTKMYQIKFVSVEVEGYGEWVSRIYHYAIWRSGGVKHGGGMSFANHLKQVADKIGWEKDPELLLEEGWDGEESMAEASRRKEEAINQRYG